MPSSPEHTFEVNVVDPWNWKNTWDKPNVGDPFVTPPPMANSSGRANEGGESGRFNPLLHNMITDALGFHSWK